MRTTPRPLIASLLLAFVSTLAQAQDASLLAGAMRVDKTSDNSFAVALGYTQRVNRYVGLSADYLNEGHPPLHHRDGLGAQLWLHSAVPERGWSVGAGVGPYYYFDTTTGNGSLADYRNLHGWGSLSSVNAVYHLHSRAYVEARLSHVHGIADHDSTMLLVGMGAELGPVSRADRRENAEPGENMIMPLVVRSIVNSFKSEKATSYGLEYRRTINPNWEWSVIGMSEGKVAYAERKGVSSQLWLLRPFTERTVLELGFGGYAMRDQIDRYDPNEKPETHYAPIGSIGMRWRLTDTWRTQLTWNRVITHYHRDSDVFLLGVGMAF
jgi:hypothetical protein